MVIIAIRTDPNWTHQVNAPNANLSAKFPTLANIQRAAQRIEPFVHRTPVLTCSTFNEILGTEIFFKCENLQKTGAFKIRGATNAVQAIIENGGDPARGVATHSSGNHAAALALAARNIGVPAYIVMPENSPSVKKNAVAGYGANITFCTPTLEAREQTLQEIVERTGATFIHPFNNNNVIAGQATAALELLTDIDALDIVMTPVGGGGLTAGTALTVHYINATSDSATRTIAAEPAGADDAYRSFLSGTIEPVGTINTIADGLLTTLGDKTFPVIQRHISDVVTVTEENIIRAMRDIWERMKIVVEPSAAVPFAALLEKKVDYSGKRIGIILSGGNVDLAKLPWTA